MKEDLQVMVVALDWCVRYALIPVLLFVVIAVHAGYPQKMLW